MTFPDSVKSEPEPLRIGEVRRAYKPPALIRFGRISGLTMGSGGNASDGGGNKTKPTGMGMGMGMSDPAAKQNIVRVATLPQGIGLYLFDYRPELRDLAGHGRQLGVMADEVEGVLPVAVSVAPDGYKMVNYSLLEIKYVDVAIAFNRASLAASSRAA